jgi:hypothetical protein
MAKHNANKTRRGKKSTVKKVVKSARKSRKVRKSRKNAIFGGDFHNNSKNNETGVPSFVKKIYNVLGILTDMINYNYTDKRDNRTKYKWDFGIGINDDKVQRFKNYMITLKANISNFVKDDVLNNIKFVPYKNRVVNRRNGEDVDPNINYSFGAQTIGKFIDQTTLTSVFGNEDFANAIKDNDLKIRIIRLFYLSLSSKYIFDTIPFINRKINKEKEAIRQILLEEYEDVKKAFLKKSSDADYWIVHTVHKSTNEDKKLIDPDKKLFDPDKKIINPDKIFFEFKFDAPTKLWGNKRPGFRFKVRKYTDTMTPKNYETKDHVDKDTIAF